MEKDVNDWIINLSSILQFSLNPYHRVRHSSSEAALKIQGKRDSQSESRDEKLGNWRIWQDTRLHMLFHILPNRLQKERLSSL